MRGSLIGLDWAREFARRFGRYIDAFMPFPGFPGFPEQEASGEALLGFLREARERRFDVVVQLHGNGRFSNGIVQSMAPKRAAGFYADGSACPDRGTFIAWPEQGSEIVRLLALMEAIGAPPQGAELEFPLQASDWSGWESLVDGLAITPGNYLVMHPGARMLSRRWPLERFAAIGRALAAEGWRIVVTGTPVESRLGEDLVAAIGSAALSFAGATTLGSLAALIARSAILICNDTGVSHLAAALRVPSVVVACGSDAARWAPLDARAHRVFAHDVPCRPCAHYVCPIGHPCALEVHAADVLAAAQKLLSRSLPRAA